MSDEDNGSASKEGSLTCTNKMSVTVRIVNRSHCEPHLKTALVEVASRVCIDSGKDVVCDCDEGANKRWRSQSKGPTTYQE